MDKPCLSKSEIDRIAEMYERGCTYDEIADAVFINVTSVNVYLKMLVAEGKIERRGHKRVKQVTETNKTVVVKKPKNKITYNDDGTVIANLKVCSSCVWGQKSALQIDEKCNYLLCNNHRRCCDASHCNKFIKIDGKEHVNVLSEKSERKKEKLAKKYREELGLSYDYLGREVWNENN